MHTIAQNAINRSVSHTEIVTIDFERVNYDSQIEADLLVACDGWTDAEDVTEYWGTTERGEWRVHVRTARKGTHGTGVYSVDDGDSNQITTGLSAGDVERVARGLADDRGESVYYYEDGSDEEPVEVRPSAMTAKLRADYDV